jgi:hypothetical protein
MLLAAVAVLPGAAWVAGEEKPAPVLAGGSRFHYVTYDAADVLARIQTELGIDEAKAKETLIRTIESSLGETLERLNTTYATWRGKRLDMTHTAWHAQELVAGQTEDVHNVIRMTLAGIRAKGLQRWQNEVTAAKQKTRDEVMGSLVPPLSASPADGQQPPAVVYATSAAPRQLPPTAAITSPHDGKQIQIEVLCLALSPEQAKQLVAQGSATSTLDTDDTFGLLDCADIRTALARIKKNPPIQVLAAPTLVTTNGRAASFKCGASEDYVVGFKDGHPQKKEFFFGTRLDTCPTLLDKDRVRVDLHLTIASSRPGEVDYQVQDSSTGKTARVKLPAVASREVRSGIEMRLGQTVVLSGLTQTAGPDGPQATVVMVRATLPGKPAGSLEEATRAAGRDVPREGISR